MKTQCQLELSMKSEVPVKMMTRIFLIFGKFCERSEEKHQPWRFPAMLMSMSRLWGDMLVLTDTSGYARATRTCDYPT